MLHESLETYNFIISLSDYLLSTFVRKLSPERAPHNLYSMPQKKKKKIKNKKKKIKYN